MYASTQQTHGQTYLYVVRLVINAIESPRGNYSLNIWSRVCTVIYWIKYRAYIFLVTIEY